MTDAAVLDLARAAGLAVDWSNYAGEPRSVTPDAMRAILRALHLPCDSTSDLADSRHRLGNIALANPPLLLTTKVGQSLTLPTEAAIASAQLHYESDAAPPLDLFPVGGALTIPPQDRPGYHRLVLGDRKISIAVAPERAIRINELVPRHRALGLAAQVYGLRRKGGYGIGDAACVSALATEAAALGVDALALSPMHALFADDATQYGPYAPSSRLFLNPLYAAPELVLGNARVAVARTATGLADAFEALEQAPLVDWLAASPAKYQLLRTLFEQFAHDPGADSLRNDLGAFCREGGIRLARHACFEALHADRRRVAKQTNWHEWPAELRSPDDPAVARFAEAHAEEIHFHLFLQWVTQRGFAAAAKTARDAGMGIGLISDLAVGISPAGSEAWGQQGDVLSGLTIGAPPDLFNRRGQNWGITSFAPDALVAQGFAPFLATVRASLRDAGGVRIDHAIGLERLWVVPDGATAADGAYLHYPVRDLMNLLALESYRHRAVVIGEDLGTIPAGFHDQFDGAGLYGMRVMWFEQNDTGFTPPEHWSRSVVAMTSTHDLPTVAGWWRGHDIGVRVEHNTLGPNLLEADLKAERSTHRAALWQAACAAGAAEGEAPAPDHPDRFVDAALRFVAKTPSELYLLPLEDVLGCIDQPNLPGTIDEHPNWRRRMPGPVDELLKAPDVTQRLEAIKRERSTP